MAGGWGGVECTQGMQRLHGGHLGGTLFPYTYQLLRILRAVHTFFQIETDNQQKI